jgi:hypothetical protein
MLKEAGKNAGKWKEDNCSKDIKKRNKHGKRRKK